MFKTKVINIRDSTGAEDEVYIGRAGKGNDGYFGNPIVKGKPCLECGKTHTTNGSTLSCYEKYLQRRLREDEVFREKVRELFGKVLVCFCHDKSKCHGTILGKYADNMNYEIVRENPLL